MLKSLCIYIVEDEPLIIVNLKFAFRKRGIQVAGHSDEYETSLKEIESLAPNMVLLDIQLMGEKDGVDLAMKLDEKNIPYLFLTSQTDPATIARVKQTNPLGYIVKPFTEAGLISNIELAWHQISLAQDEFISIKSDGRKYKINQANIQYLKAFDNYCYIVTIEQEYLVPYTLKKVSEELNPGYFIQTHRSYWVNSRKVTSIASDKVIIDDIEVPLSYSRKEALQKRMQF